MAKKLSVKEIQDKLKEVNPKVSISTETYINMRTKCRFYDEDHGEFWAIPRSVIGRKQRHPKHSSEKRAQTTFERFGVRHVSQCPEIRTKWKKTIKEKYGVESPLQNPDSLSKMRSTLKSRFGATNAMNIPKFIEKQQQTMLDRYGVRHSLGKAEFRDKAVKQTKATNMARYGVESTLELGSVREKIKSAFLNKYGVEHSFQSPELRAKGRQTLIDNGFESSPEKEVRDFINSLGVNTEKRFLGGNPGFEIDIVCPERRIAVEYNGDYWHSEANHSINRHYHLQKTQRCEIQGIQLIHIFGSEWKNKREIVKDFIRSKLGIFDQKLMARKLEIKEISGKESADFFNKNHLQGAPKTWRAWGLFQENRLVAAASFSKPHRQNMGLEPHLSRFACELGVHVSGALSRLCSNAFKHIGPFVSFVHLRISNGNSYLKSGFTEIKTLPPDYWYWDSKNCVAVSKQSRKKSAVNTPEGTTEREHAAQDGLYRIWDCGKKKYRWEGRA